MEIEKNIPVPPRKSGHGITATLKLMEIGDSVVINKKDHLSWRSAATSINFKIAVRAISDSEARVWRVK